ncbi:hypothetical protein L1987_06571 [Smallanthus sonchifolius]|uniref:Uncharacterized protein n=1 Tax=Smallanthus sonchifolius TaxID=185202 RepID=A0ACB9JYR4_9ASTR|nr:hypothetical protein L1987_06571 [Smallanthus sonchifolius]
MICGVGVSVMLTKVDAEKESASVELNDGNEKNFSLSRGCRDGHRFLPAAHVHVESDPNTSCRKMNSPSIRVFFLLPNPTFRSTLSAAFQATYYRSWTSHR